MELVRAVYEESGQLLKLASEVGRINNGLVASLSTPFQKFANLLLSNRSLTVATLTGSGPSEPRA